ncbi:MAG: HAMP domain-containing sensor histidine kinase, partial [Bacteriovoracaceae bacterium]
QGATDAIERGKRQIKKINALIDEFLDASKLQAGELKLKTEDCELSSLLRKVVDQWKEIKPNRIFNAEIENIRVKCDLSRMERVFHNLLSNAIKYSDEKNPIKIKLKKENPDCAHLIVEDFGTGISEDELKEIFLPFKRSTSAADMAEGTGLGLSNVRMIIEAHGGKAWAESQIGKGSQFHARIPMAR